MQIYEPGRPDGFTIVMIIFSILSVLRRDVTRQVLMLVLYYLFLLVLYYLYMVRWTSKSIFAIQAYSDDTYPFSDTGTLQLESELSSTHWPMCLCLCVSTYVYLYVCLHRCAYVQQYASLDPHIATTEYSQVAFSTMGLTYTLQVIHGHIGDQYEVDSNFLGNLSAYWYLLICGIVILCTANNFCILVEVH